MPKGTTVVKIREQLNERADGLQKQIEAKMNPAIAEQNLTPRRIKIARQMRQDGERLQKVQQALRGLAAFWGSPFEAGAAEDLQYLIDNHLTRVRNKPTVLDVLSPYTKIDYDRGLEESRRLAKAGITTQEQLEKARDALQVIVDSQPPDGPSEEERAIRAKEEDLVGLKIPGFFPTPPEIIEQMLDIAEDELDEDDWGDFHVLEPSAGKGDIADGIRERFPTADLHVGEINHELADLLELKGFSVKRADFLDQDPAEFGSDLFQVIIMNPPFEKGQDMEHIRHAYKWLSDMGILISVISEGPFFREDKQSVEFREWLGEKRASSYWVDLDAGAFSKAFRSTGVKSRIVVIRVMGEA